MKERECRARIDMLFRDKQTGIKYHVTKVMTDNSDNLIGFELTAYENVYNVTGEWINTHVKNKRLEYMNTLNSDLGYEYDAITKMNTIYVIK